jgi:hypothetical protein
VKIKRAPFRLLLPVVALAVWVILVPSYAGLQYYRVRHLRQGSEQAIDTIGAIAIRVPKDRWFQFVMASIPEDRYHAVAALNLPGLIPDVLLSLPTTQPGKWHPSTLTLEAWRSYALPFYCLPFWWFVGHGLDTLLARRRLRQVGLWAGSALFLVCIVCLFGYVTSRPGDQADLRWLVPGFGLWAVLFAILPFNWLRRKNTGERVDGER